MRKTWIGLFCSGLALATVGCASHHHAPRAAVSDSEAIFVVGEGEALGKPDRVRLNLGVEARAETLDAAMKDATARMKGLREALLKLGVAEKDMKTGQFSISQTREPVTITYPTEPVPATKASPAGAPVSVASPPRVEERWVERYVVMNTLEVVYPDLTRAGDLIAAAVAGGANNSWGLGFEVSDPKPLQAEARSQALADAKKRAEQIAQATGVKLGRVLSVSEGGTSGGGPIPPMYAKAERMMAMDASVPIEAGEAKVQASVQVVYAIEY